jgi:heme A synthase
VVTGGFYLLQLGVGAANVYLQAPVWIQMVHLLISDFIWIGLILTACEALSRERTPVTRRAELQTPDLASAKQAN